MMRKSEVQKRAEQILAKYPGREFCKHDFVSMLDLDEDEEDDRTLIPLLLQWGSAKRCYSGTCTSCQTPHKKIKATEGLLARVKVEKTVEQENREFEKMQEEENEEEED